MSLLDDLLFRRQLMRRLEEGWDFDKIRPMTTEAIIAKLNSFGILIDEASFLAEIEGYDSAQKLADGWREKYDCTATGNDLDFLWMAAIVLWERLAPDVINMEMIDDLMQEGYTLLEQRDWPGACDAWWQTWEWIREKLTPEMTTVKPFDDIFMGYQSVFNWSQDFEMELGNAGLDDPTYYRKRIQYCREFYTQFRDESENMLGNFHRAEAESLWSLGEIAAAEEKFRELIALYPDWPWGYIGWADCYWLLKDSPKQYDKAETIYLKALATPNLRNKDDVLDRLASLYEEKGDAKKAAYYRSQIEPRQQLSWQRPLIPIKVGRNDPCPCGSGKKYKHCCLRKGRG